MTRSRATAKKAGTQTLAFPAPAELINANHRTHWRTKAKLTKAWRDASAAYLRQAWLRPVDRAHVVITFSFPDNRRRDVGNLQPTAKAIVDGLVDGGLFVDDDDAHLTGPDLRRGAKCDGAVRVVVEITEDKAA